MKKLLNIISALSIMSTFFLFSCALPNTLPENNQKDNYEPTNPTEDFDKITAPQGGSSNQYDVFKGNKIVTGKYMDKGDTFYKLGEDGTFSYIMGDFENAKGNYKVDDKNIYFVTDLSMTPYAENQFITYDKAMELALKQAEEDKTSKEEHCPWKDYVDYCKGNTDKADKMNKARYINDLSQRYQMNTYSYEKIGAADSKTYKLTSIAPKIVSLQKQSYNVELNFDLSPIEKYYFSSGDMFISFDDDLWVNNKVPFIKLDNDNHPTNEIIYATYKITGEGNDQVIKFTFPEETVECKVVPQTINVTLK